MEIVQIINNRYWFAAIDWHQLLDHHWRILAPFQESWSKMLTVLIRFSTYCLCNSVNFLHMTYLYHPRLKPVRFFCILWRKKNQIILLYRIIFTTFDCSHLIGDGASIRCCTKDGRRILPREKLHFACLPIFIEPDDDFYSQFDQGCMNFVRSALAPDGQCQLGYGKQVQ